MFKKLEKIDLNESVEKIEYAGQKKISKEIEKKLHKEISRSKSNYNSRKDKFNKDLYYLKLKKKNNLMNPLIKLGGISNVSYPELVIVEKELNASYNKSRNPEFFLETKKGSQLVKKWRSLIKELRGWDEVRFEDGIDLTKDSWGKLIPSWLDPNYKLGDVLA